MTEENTFGNEVDDKQIKSSFDALDIGSNVHSETQTVTRDIIISRTSKPLEDWGRNQVLYTKDMQDLLNGHKAKAESQKDEKSVLRIEIMQHNLELRYLGEMQLLYAHTRSRDGKTHDALIDNKKQEIQEKIDTLQREIDTKNDKNENQTE